MNSVEDHIEKEQGAYIPAAGTRDAPYVVPQPYACSSCQSLVTFAQSLEITNRRRVDGREVADAIRRDLQTEGELCSSCLLRGVGRYAGPAWQATMITERVAYWDNLRHELGVPDDATMQHMSQSQDDNPQGLTGFLLELVGIPIYGETRDDDHPAGGVPQIKIRVGDGPLITYVIVLRSVGRMGTSSRMEARYDLEQGIEGDLQVKGWAGIETEPDFRRLMEGINLLRSFTPARGRPKGSTHYTDEELRRRLRDRYDAWEEERGEAPRQLDLAQEFGISERTIQRRRLWPRK